MNDEQLPVGNAGNLYNSGKFRFYAIVTASVLLIWLVVVIVQKNNAAPQEKSTADVQLERLRAAKEKGNQAKADQVATLAGNSPDQPVGDPASLKLLQEIQAKKEQEAKASRDAEDAAAAELEYLHYSRKTLLLEHDPRRAEAWLNRVNTASTKGQLTAVPNMTKEQEAVLREKNPALLQQLAQLRAGNIGGAAEAVKAKQTQAQAQAKAGAPAGRPSNVQDTTRAMGGPASIDPKTGLPLEATTVAETSGLNADGSPDIDGGAYPVQFAYVPVGQKDPVTVTRWVKAGYLTGRPRPYNPSEVLEADRAYRASLKAPSDISPEKDGSSLLIPHRPSASRYRVQDDFVARTPHVTVIPNPALIRR